MKDNKNRFGEFNWEIRELAEKLYVEDGLTQTAVGRKLNIWPSTINKWARDQQWSSKREEFRKTKKCFDESIVQLKTELLKKAVNSLDPQTIYALANIHTVFNENNEPRHIPLKGSIVNDVTQSDAIKEIEKAISLKLNAIGDGNITANDISEIDKMFKVLEKMKAKYQPKEEKKKVSGFTTETVEKIRKDILGVKD